MSRFDYEVALELIENRNVSYESLIMALITKRPPGEQVYRLLRENFPDLIREYWDRAHGVDGFLRGESRVADEQYRERDLQALITDNKGMQISELRARWERNPKEVGKSLR